MKSISGYRGLIVGALLSALLSACGGDDGVVGTGFDNSPGGLIRVSGSAEKGPFVKGSEVLVSRLSADGTPSTETSLSEIADDMGTFVFQLSEAGPVMIAADGYHFNEISGALSQGRLLLRAVYNASADTQQKAYVNVLTHLAYKRTLALMAKGMAVGDAIQTSASDVLQALKPMLPITDVTDFTQLSIYNIDTNRAAGNAYELALSATVYQYAMQKAAAKGSSVDAELTALLNAMADAIATDGAISDTALLSALTATTRELRPDLILANLEKRSVDIKKEKLPVANMDLFIDTDGDGLVNAQDDDIDNDGIANAEDASPYVYSEAPVLVPNAATAGVASKTPFTLEWTTSEYAKQIEVQLVKDSSDGTVIVDEITATKQYTFTLESGVYYVRARAQNSLGGWGPWSNNAELAVDVFAIRYTVPNSPRAVTGAYSFAVTKDGGFIVTGAEAPPADQPLVKRRAGFVAKMDAAGGVVWRKSIAGDFDVHLENAIEAPGGGFLIALRESETPDSNASARVIKLSAAGNEVWRSGALSAKATPTAYHQKIELLQDRGLVLVGMSEMLRAPATGLESPDLAPLVVALDAKTGALGWSYSLADTANTYDALTGLWTTAGGNYMIAGNHDRAAGPGSRPFVLTLSASGQVIATVSTPADFDAEGLLAVPSADGGYFLSTRQPQWDSGTAWQAWLYKVSDTGSNVFGGKLDVGCSCAIYEGASVFTTPNLVLAGGQAELPVSGGAGSSETLQGVAIVELEPATGAVLARRRYAPPSSSLQLKTFAPMAEGRTAVFGEAWETSDFVIVKTDVSGIAPKSLTRTVAIAP